ncbi:MULTISPECIES: serine/threonine-protein kinase [Kitasatospora]|uniref:non-specific serine/threonine protein kinase n=1 Tax=Kitasatospora setae (strain ATCC 33774 / DSM 43861 / JCM 3304 / KCC A-0304 / NBRC 14216 / KM-6054) TaxID=452652 RepID=E4NCH9_KITSK|nr:MULTISPECIES: serine/threonine-protein kinase [Kitasatospora]BAJ28910.1 putative serine/threonine protein kinase [Kitasatospora setae KM-6054]
MGAQDQSTGRLLAGRYALGERLGRGGMGTVWRARDEMLDREVAVKELTVSHLSEEDLEILQSRMKREARAAARIKHPGVITIHDVLEQDGRPWIVMELVDGRALSDVISQDGTLTPREAADVGLQVLAALHRGHQLGVLHRDVKPANVLLEHGTGRVVLLDFGIAKFEGAMDITRPGDLVGSPDYLAPERAQGQRPGPASDLWALGATLFHAVEGESPFRRDNPLSTLTAVVDEPLPTPARAAGLGPVLAALMAKDPAERPGADEAGRMLREVADGHTVSIRVPEQAGASRLPTQLVPVVDRTTEPAAPAEPAAETATAAPVAAAPPVAPPAGPPAPAGSGRRRGRPVLWAVVGVLLLAAAGGGAAYYLNDRHVNVTVTRGPSPTAGTDNPLPSDSPLPSGAPAPAGYAWQDDPAGFRFLLPTAGTWTRTEKSGQIYYSPDGLEHFLQFAVTVGQPLAPQEHLLQMEASLSRSLKDFQTTSLSAAKIRGQEGAVWEFSFGAKDARRHAKEVEFRRPDGTAFMVYVSGPEKDWLESLRQFTVVLNNFQPAI